MALNQDKKRLLDRIEADVSDQRVVGAMMRVDREAFIPEASAHLAYDDVALPIGEGQTISQPYIVALMVSALEVRTTDSVLEVGTGSGYQAAVLAQLARQVTTVERISTLAEGARARLASLGLDNVTVHPTGDALGWPPGAPYNGIIVAAAAPRLPGDLIDQLDTGGRLVVPVGSREQQELMKITRTAEGISVETLGSCRFVPLVGEGAWEYVDGE
jgi:protein-L-isoaspartate(D-aspartate) O-methyltransferase